MLLASSRPLFAAATLGGAARNRRTNRIVIPSIDKNVGGSSTPNEAARDAFARGGAMSSDRFIAGRNSNNAQQSNSSSKLFEGRKYISNRRDDRWSGDGPMFQVKAQQRKGWTQPTRQPSPASRSHAFDPNDHAETYGRVVGSPSHDLLSPGEDVAKLVGGTEADFVRQRRERQRFLNAVDSQHEQVWRDSKSHLRAQEHAMDVHGGIEGAIAHNLSPKTPTARNELMNRPLDKRILEEIYRDLHGKRSEQTLKKNVAYERWTARSDANAPVMASSRKAQETFGFGGTAQIMRHATTRDQFPVTPLPEVAFLGRTNSGRSSLINAILNNYVCRYGHMKGTTKTADFINVANKLIMVDLPGYGYFHPFSSDPLRVKQGQEINEAYIAACAANPIVGGKTNDAIKGEASDEKLVAAAGRQRNIKRVFICVPSTTGLQDGDISLCDMLEERAIPFTILLTKTDLLAVRMLARMADLTRSKIAKYSHCEELMLVNALRLAGITRVQNLLGNIARKEALGNDPLSMDFSNIV